LTNDLVPNYVSAIPFDPQGNSEKTGYAVKKDTTNNRITVRACYAELNQSIEVSR
jgi:hypothetical protein